MAAEKRIPASRYCIWFSLGNWTAVISFIIFFFLFFLVFHFLNFPSCYKKTCIPFWGKSALNRFSHVRLFVTPWTVAHEASLSMEFSRQEYWSGLPFPSPGDLPDPGIEHRSLALQTDSLPSEQPGKPVCPKKKAFLRKLLFQKSSHLVHHLGSSHTTHLGCVY